MIRIHRQLLTTLLFSLIFVAGAAAQTKVATIDLRRVFDDYYKTKAADAKLKDEAGSLDKDRKVLTDQYQKLTEEYKKALDAANSMAVSVDERDKNKKSAEAKLLEIRELEQNITQFDRTARGNLEEKQRQLRDRILEEIRAVVNQRAKSSGYALVIDSAAESVNRTPMVMFNNGENDITDGVLAVLNAAAPPSSTTTKPAEPAGTKK
jgi:outer membrane protein